MPELSEHLQQFVDRQVSSGQYGSADEVLADALHLLEARETLLAELDAALAEGCADLDRGAMTDAVNVFDALEDAYRPLGMPPRPR